MHSARITPDQIGAKALEVLRQLDGLSYADALHVLDVAQRSLADSVERLHAEQIFSAPAVLVGHEVTYA